MGTKSVSKSNKFDLVKWGLIGLLLVAGLVLNDHFRSVALPLRMIAWIVLLAIMLGVAALTSKGEWTISFAREARSELRKVVWPNRQETMRITALVVGLILIMGLLLWGIDSALLWAMSWVTG